MKKALKIKNDLDFLMFRTYRKEYRNCKDKLIKIRKENYIETSAYYMAERENFSQPSEYYWLLAEKEYNNYIDLICNNINYHQNKTSDYLGKILNKYFK